MVHACALAYGARVMHRTFRIRIDLPLLRRTLSTQDGREVSTCEVRQWLLDARFVPDGEGWLVCECNLGHLQPEEVTNAEVFDAPADELIPAEVYIHIQFSRHFDCQRSGNARATHAGGEQLWTGWR